MGATTQAFFQAAVSDRAGRRKLQVSGDLYNSSLLHVSKVATVDRVEEVEVAEFYDDLLVSREKITGRGLLKIDVQYAEHMVLAGGREFVAGQVDAIIWSCDWAVPPEARLPRDAEPDE